MQGVQAEWYAFDDEDDVGVADPAPMLTLCIAGGKKDKLRPGDLLGALTGDAGLLKEQVGKINILEFNSYVALDRRVAQDAFDRLNGGNPLGVDFGTIKGRNFKMRFLDV